jgi:hypothetical protein
MIGDCKVIRTFICGVGLPIGIMNWNTSKAIRRNIRAQDFAHMW